MSLRSVLRLGASFLATLFLAASALRAQPVFTAPGFVDEALYAGNGMISLRFDSAGRLYVGEKQGRVLLFRPNVGVTPLSFAYQYYEYSGNWSALADFTGLSALASGSVTTLDTEAHPARRADNFGLRFTGSITIESAGSHTFYTRSDDGSRLWINGQLVVNNYFNQGATERSGSITLAAGTHEMVVEYYDSGGGETLSVSYEGPGLPKQIIGANSGPYLAPLLFADFRAQVNTEGERGFLGLALDPDYDNNRYVYVLFSTATDQRLVRYTANPAFTAVDPASELVLLSGLPNANPVHKAGDIAFHPDDPHSLYIMLGDDGDRYSVANLATYKGKLLRVDSSTGQGLPSNPFWNGDANSVASRVWAHSFRNPFRFAFDPAAPVADVLYISENGDGTDRVARIAKGANGGWDAQFTADSVDGLRKILRTTTPSLTGISIIRGGVFAPGGVALYNSRYGTGPNSRGEIRRWYLTGPALDTVTPFPEDLDGNGDQQPFMSGYTGFNIVTTALGPDGHLYYTDSGQGSALGTGYRLGRIRFQGGTPPVASFSASVTNGPAPLTVTFTDASTAASGSIASRAWNFGDGTTSTLTNPVKTYSAPGVYPVSLTVATTQGLTHVTTATITAVHTVQLTVNAQLFDATTLSNFPFAAATTLGFYQADGVTPLPVPGGSGHAANFLPVPSGGILDTTVAVELTGPGVVLSAGESDTDGVEPAFVGFALSNSLSAQSVAPVFHLSALVVRGRVIDTLGQSAVTDLGFLRAGQPYALSAGRDFLVGSGHPPTSVPHRLVTDALGYYHAPLRPGDGDAVFTVDLAADTQPDILGQPVLDLAVPASGSLVRDITVGRHSAGLGRDDTSAIAPTPAIVFANQIQPVFNSLCIACHNDIATNSGGLDLQSSASLTALVNQRSAFAPGVKLVDPGHPDRSFLWEKINSATPQRGTRMRPGDPIPLAQQALIRDWITQLGSTGTLQLSSTSHAVQESTGNITLTLTVRRVGGSSGAVSVQLATVPGGTAVPDEDFQALSTTLNWADGDTSDRTVTLTLLADTLVDDGKTLGLRLSSPTGGALLAPAPGAVVVLTDTPFQLWRGARHGSAANSPAGQPSADPDGNGLANLLEYALGASPSPASSVSLPTATPVGAPPHLELSFNRIADPSLTYRVQAVSSLASTWTDIWTSSGSSNTSGLVTVPDPISLTDEPRRFLRLVITQ